MANIGMKQEKIQIHPGLNNKERKEDKNSHMGSFT